MSCLEVQEDQAEMDKSEGHLDHQEDHLWIEMVHRLAETGQ